MTEQGSERRNDSSPEAGEASVSCVRLAADAQLLNALRQPKPKIDLNAIVQLVQIVALMAGGAWAYYLYLSFQEESNSLALEAARLSQVQARLSLKKTTLEMRQSAHELAKGEQTPVTDSAATTAEAVAGEAKTYLITFSYGWTNTGDSPITISPVLAEAFYGEVPTRLPAVVVLNDVSEKGIVRWGLKSRRGYIVASDWKPDTEVVNDDDSAPAERGGGGVARLQRGESATGLIMMRVTGKLTDLVGFRVRYTIDAGSDHEVWRRIRQVSTLANVERGSE